MRKIASCILTVFIAYTLTACGQMAGSAKAGDVLTLKNDIGISVDGTWYPIHEDSETLLTALGNDYELLSAPSCVFEGEDKEFSYSNCSVFTNPDKERDIWYDILLKDSSLQTARGIKTGDTLESVQAAYGDKYYWEGETILTYSVSGVEGDIESPCIQFTIKNGVVELIEIYYPTNVT